MRKLIIISLLFLFARAAWAQSEKDPVVITGTVGVSYDYYGLNTDPDTVSFYNPRRPTHLLRFNLNPTITVGKFKLPINVNVSPMRYNFNGIGGYWPDNIPRPRQTVGQFLSNPINRIGMNPGYKWAELQLGTQYLQYSPLSTGDLGVFGAGFSLKPGNFRLKMFHGMSQQKQAAIYTPPPGVLGIYQRNQSMAQIGFEKDGVYFAGFNIVKSRDIESSIPAIAPADKPPHPDPQEAVVVTFLLKLREKNGWYFSTELGNSYHSRNINDALAPTVNNGTFKGLPGLITPRISTVEGFAQQTSIGKKSKLFDVGLNSRFFSSGYFTAGYPFLQNDRLDFTVNTRLSSADSKYSFTGDIGQRFTNWSGARNKQLIANANLFARFTNQFSLNATYNNFGFEAPAVGSFTGLKNVANDLSINPALNWSSTKMSHLLSATYSWSKYNEIILPNPPTSNNTQSALLLYVPAFFEKKISPDFSVLWFNNSIDNGNIDLTLYTGSAGFSLPIAKPKMTLKGQLQYTNTKLDAFTPSNNWLATAGFNWPVTKKLSWNLSATINFLRYGNELTPPPYMLGANYTESHLRTSLQYRLGK